MEERLTLRNVGAFIYDPRLVTLYLEGTIGLTQDWFTTAGRGDFDRGTLWGYDTSAHILPESAYSLYLFANRHQVLPPRVLGGVSEVESENRGATLYARRLYIPSTLTFRQELRDEQPLFGNTTARRKEDRRIFTYEGQRGWIDSEMDLRYEFVDSSDEVFPNLSYRNHEGNLNYGLDFGSELDWHWDSRLRAFTRTGATDLTTWTVDELLRIDHTDRLQSQFRYFLTHIDTTGGATTTHTGEASLRHQLYESLTTTLALDTITQTLTGGRKASFRGRLDFAYSKRLPGNGRVLAGLGGSFQYEDNRFDVTQSFIPQELHTFAIPFALPLPLNNPFVVTASIVVTKVAVGPLPAGCIPPPGPPLPLVLGQDYTVRPSGDFTELVPTPCAGIVPGINPGDTVAVDYRFAVSPSLTFTTATWRANVSLDYRWIRPYFTHEQSDQHLLSGRDGRFLDAVKSDTVGTELRYDGQRLRGSLLVEARRFTSHRQTSYDSVRSAQIVSLSILPELTFSFSADQVFVSYSDPDRDTRILAGRAALMYGLNASLFVDASGGIRWYKDTLSPTEQAIEASLRLRWLIRKLEVNPTFEFFDRRRGDSDLKEYRVTLHIIRRF